MNKPQDWESININSYTPPTLGGHTMVIKGVREQKSSGGSPMIVVAYDFDKADSQPGLFNDEFEADIRPDKKWPHAGTAYIMTQDWQDPSKTSKNFKRFIVAVEKSNGFECAWGAKFCEQFAGKKVGGVFGEVENEWNGKVSMRHELRWFCEYDKAAGATVPEPKYLKSNNSTKNDSDGFMAVDNSTDAVAIPF